MDPIRRRMSSLLIEAAHKEIEALSPDSPYAEKLCQIEVDAVVAGEIEKLCNAASLGEITKASVLIKRLKKANENEREKITDQLNSIAAKLIRRVEDKNGPLKCSELCLELFSML